MKDATLHLAGRLLASDAMKTRFRRLPFFFLLGIGLCALNSATGQEAPPSADSLREEAFRALSSGALREAQPLFQALAAASDSGFSARREATFYANYTALALDLAQAGFGRWQMLSRDPWGSRLKALEVAAEELRARAPREDVWLTAYEHLGAIQTAYRWQEGRLGLGAYEEIFQYWAESTQLDEARQQYLRLVGHLAEVRELPYDRRAALAPYVENAASLAVSPEDIQRFQWLWAAFLDQFEGAPTQQLRRGTALRQAIAAGEKTPTAYYCRALLDYGEWASRYGVSFYGESGALRFRPDYALAAETYRKLLALEDGADAARRREAASRLESIESAELDVLVTYNFRPETEITFFLKWRNLEPPAVRIYALEPRLVAEGFFEKFESLDNKEWPVLEEQVLSTAAEAPHYAVDERVRLETELAPGSYLIEAQSGNAIERSLLLVSDLALVTHVVDGAVVGYACDPTSGHPVEGASVYSVMRDPESLAVPEEITPTDQNGLVSMPLVRSGSGGDQLLVVSHPDRGVALSRQPFAAPYTDTAQLKVYGMAERELFRPGDAVRAHFWARWATSEGWEPVAAETAVNYRVVGPQGNAVAEGAIALDALGSGSVSFELQEDAVIGSYAIHYRIADQTDAEDAVYGFFRVEAFRAPEIEVEISLDAPSEGIRLVGDALSGTVEVSYYAGGEVEDAAVELLVHRQRFIPWPLPSSQLERAVGEGRSFRPAPPSEEIQRSTLRTDARGLASFEIPTLDDGEAEWTYTLEARVRDLSRREVIARRDIVLSRQGYYARIELAQRLIAPGDRAELAIQLQTAQKEPVSDRGTLRVTRERWREIYIHRRRGNEIGAETYRSLPERSLLVSAQSDYYLKEKGFVTEEVLIEEIATDASGYSQFSFEPEEVGYYNFNWVSRGRRGQPIVAEASLWVTDEATTEIGYRPGGVELIADRGPHAPGDVVPLLISVPGPNRFVLVSIVGEALIESFVVPVEGTSHLVSLEPTSAYQPNVYITATMVADANVYHDEFELLVPPEDQLLNVSLTPDADGYEPRDTARFQVAVHNADGEPVSTQVALSVSDDSLYAIAPQQRPHVVDSFYGHRRHNRLALGGSMHWRAFFRPLESDSAQAENASEFPQTSLDRQGSEMNSLQTGSEGLLEFSARSRPAPDLSALSSTGTVPAMVGPSLTRRDFRSTAFWNPRVQTDEAGQAVIEFRFPDNITEWRADAVVVTESTEVGEALIRTSTRLPLIARLQAPRFLTQRDEVVLAGTFQNNSEEAETVEATLSTSAGLELEGTATRRIEVPPNSTRRLEWKARATVPGSVTIDLRASSQRADDAVELSIPVASHGMEVLEGVSGRHWGEYLELTFDLPEGTRGAEVRLLAAPTLATQLFSALPYLIEYPYGSTEQIIGRFLPALAVRRAMRDLGYSLEIIDSEIYRGLTEAGRGERQDLREVLQAVTKSSVEGLATAQRPDGSWSWTPEGETDRYMTGYAVYALTLAEELDVPLGNVRLGAAREWVERAMTEHEMSAADRAWLLHALSSRHRADGFGRPSRLEARAFLALMDQRSELGPMHLALLALTARYFGFEEDTAILLDNLANFARESEGTLDDATDAAGHPLTFPQVHWGETEKYFEWSEGAVETTAMALEALLVARPEHPWVESAVTWLVRNRTGTHWQSTRATALAILALTSYLQAHEGPTNHLDWSISVNDESIDLPVSRDPGYGGWSPPLDLKIPEEFLRSGENRLVLRQPMGGRNYYFALHTSYYSTEESIAPAASDLAITRSVQHLAPVPTLLGGIKEEMRPLTADDSRVSSGDRMEVTLRIETTRDLDYVLIEDVKPAGLEAVQQLSDSKIFLTRVVEAEGAADVPSSVPAHQQLLDRKVGFLVDRLPAGTWELRYRLRAETPGDFHGLPATAEAIYLPGVRGHSNEFHIRVMPEEDNDAKKE